MSLLPSIIYPSTAKAAADKLLASLEGTQNTAAACTSLDAATAASWATFYATAKAFLSEAPGIFGLGTRMDRIEAYAAELFAWQTLLSSKQCALSVPSVDPKELAPDTKAWVSALQWGVVAVVAVAGAYGIGKVVEILPKPGAPARPSRARALGQRTASRLRALRA